MNESQIEQHIKRLNRGDGRSVSAEWEVVLANCFSKLGNVEYEPNLGGPSHPDLLISVPGVDPFVAEIVSVSDAGYENANPVRYFETAFERLARKKGMGLGGFDFRFGGNDVGVFREQKTQILLPPKSDIDSFVEGTFCNFLDDIAREPEKTHRHSYRDSRTDITVTYDPSDRGTSGSGHPSYTTLKAREANTLYKALARKANRLKQSAYSGPKGIIVCDGGASYLYNIFGSATSIGIREIIGNFFRKHLSVSFVMVVRTQSRDSSLRREVMQLSRDIFLNGYLPDTPNGPALTEILSKSVDIAPRPLRLAINSWQQVPHRYRLLANSHYGGVTLGSSRMKISARTVQALLVGELSQGDFRSGHEDLVQCLKRTLEQGRSITAASVEVSTDEDDDWLVLEFGEPDPAHHPFINPGPKTGS